MPARRSTSPIALGDGHTLPASAAAAVVAIVGRGGSGRTETATTLGRQLLQRGVQVLVLDPGGRLVGGGGSRVRPARPWRRRNPSSPDHRGGRAAAALARRAGSSRRAARRRRHDDRTRRGEPDWPLRHILVSNVLALPARARVRGRLQVDAAPPCYLVASSPTANSWRPVARRAIVPVWSPRRRATS